MREIIRELKPSQRKVIELRFFEGKQYNEIADEVDIPIGSVKAQIFRIKQLLNKKLSEKQKENGTISDSNKK